MLLRAVEWLMFWGRPKNVERGRRRSVLRYRGADKSLARPGRKQARKHVWDARDFNNIETRAVIIPHPPARQGAERNSHHSDRNISLFPSWSGQELISTLYNTYCFSTRRLVSRTHRNVTLHVHCLCCYNQAGVCLLCGTNRIVNCHSGR